MLIKEMVFFKAGDMDRLNKAIIRIDNKTPDEIEQAIKEQAEIAGRTEFTYQDTETRP